MTPRWFRSRWTFAGCAVAVVLGLIGAPLVFAINAAKVFGVFGAIESWAGIGVVPIFAWEVSLAVYLIVRGVRRD